MIVTLIRRGLNVQKFGHKLEPVKKIKQSELVDALRTLGLNPENMPRDNTIRIDGGWITFTEFKLNDDGNKYLACVDDPDGVGYAKHVVRYELINDLG